MRILIFAPHNDDEVLGAGGTLAKYAKQGHDVIVCEVTSGIDTENIQAEARAAHRVIGIKDTIFLNLPVVELKEYPAKELNRAIQQVVNDIKPDITFIPNKGDLHGDHSEVAKSAMVALRPHINSQLKAIYAYETLSETEWGIPTQDNLFIPNVWNDITDFISVKLEAMRCYKSQLMEFPHPRSLIAIEALSQIRGSTICVKHAECFMLIRGCMPNE